MAQFPKGFYSFYAEERCIVEEVYALVKAVLVRPDITPRQVSQVGVLLFALSRLPRPTPGVALELEAAYRRNQDMSYQRIRLDEDSFQIDSGGYIYTKGVGGDSYSSTTFEAGIGWRDGDADWMGISDWLERFREAIQDTSETLSLSDDVGEPFQWKNFDTDDNDDLWSALPSLDGDDEDVFAKTPVS